MDKTKHQDSNIVNNINILRKGIKDMDIKSIELEVQIDELTEQLEEAKEGLVVYAHVKTTLEEKVENEKAYFKEVYGVELKDE